MDSSAIQALQRFEQRAILSPEEPLRHMEPIVWVDADQMGVKSGMVDFRERNAIGNHRLAEQLILVRHNVAW